MARKESIRTRKITYTAVFEAAPEGGYTATVPALSGCITEGDTLEEARAMAEEAILGYLESLEKDGLPIPPGEEHSTTALREEISVTLKHEPTGLTHPSSWPGLSRPSTTSMFPARQGVDARHKAGHDDSN